MTFTTKLTTSIAAAIALAAPAFAQDATIDINGDGMYSFPEITAVYPDVTEESFSAMDASGDGLLDAEEIAAAAESGQLPS